MIPRHCAMSRAICCRSRSGGPEIGRSASLASRSRIGALSMAWLAAAFSRATCSGGVPAGQSKPVQKPATSSG